MKGMYAWMEGMHAGDAWRGWVEGLRAFMEAVCMHGGAVCTHGADASRGGVHARRGCVKGMRACTEGMHSYRQQVWGQAGIAPGAGGEDSSPPAHPPQIPFV